MNAPVALQSAIARHGAGDIPGAEELYREALRHDPHEPAALALLGAICADSDRVVEAVCLLRRAVQVRPDWAEAHEQLGLAMMAAGDGDAALAELERATHLGPHLPSTFYNLANALRECGQPDSSVWAYLRAISLAPDFVEALVNLGSVLMDLKRPAEAVPHLRRAAFLRQGDARPMRSLGIALREAGDASAAEHAFRSVTAIAPDDPDGWTDLGGLLREHRRTDEALGCYLRASDLRPSFAPYQLNMGLVHEDRGEFESALACYERALQLDPEYGSARLNRTIVRLTMGDWPAAWPSEGWNALVGGEAPREFSQPRWDGGSLDGKTILVCAEQGYGDTIQFVRYLPMVKARGGRVVFECQPGLIDLVRQSGLADDVVSMRADRRPDVAFDTHIELMTLPAVFHTSLADTPSQAPYLHIPSDRAEAWRARLHADGRLKVALVWSGNSKHRNDRNRSMRLDELASVASVPGVSLYSLQKGDGSAQLLASALRTDIEDLGPDLRDFTETGAALQCMDLVITVDTSVAHLAGALGLPTWMLIPRVPDWRWLEQRTDTPWYPTMRIFRQQRQGEWEPVVRSVAADLASCALSRAA